MKYQFATSSAVLAIVVGVAGCSSTKPTAQGAAVEIVTEKPAGCRLLGEVVGSQGNAFSGDFTSDKDLMVGARNDVRNKTAALGGNVVQIQSTLNGTHPYSAGAISSTVVGNAFACAAKK